MSNELGAGHPRTAKFSVLVVSITSLLIGTILTIALFVARSRYPPLFTKSFEVQQAVYELTPLLGTTIMLNGLQPTLSGIFLSRDNAQVPPQSMPEISETHLYYTKVLLPS